MTSPCRTDRRALSVAEALVASLLMFLALSVVALLLARYRDVVSYTQKKDASVELSLALERLRGELGAAIQLISPTPGGTGDLEFVRLDPADPNRYPSPDPSSWDPVDPSQRVDVHYLVQGQQLIRRATLSGGAVDDQIVSGTVAGFTASLQGSLLTLTASCQEEQILRVYHLPVSLGKLYLP